ncbi:MAG: ATP phosphoribosyltransferase regulatory subunit [Thermomicrobiales bacterium]
MSDATRKPSILKGFRDYLPEQMILRQEIIRRFKDVFERHGFDPLDTPAIEYIEVLTGKAGENEKLMYAFEDHGGRRVGLRYDLTVPLARVVAMHQSEIIFPFKRYHVAPVWRADRPQRGRFREFWQCDADIAGVDSMTADAEIIFCADRRAGWRSGSTTRPCRSATGAFWSGSRWHHTRNAGRHGLPLGRQIGQDRR